MAGYRVIVLWLRMSSQKTVLREQGSIRLSVQTLCTLTTEIFPDAFDRFLIIRYFVTIWQLPDTTFRNNIDDTRVLGNYKSWSEKFRSSKILEDKKM